MFQRCACAALVPGCRRGSLVAGRRTRGSGFDCTRGFYAAHKTELASRCVAGLSRFTRSAALTCIAALHGERGITRRQEQAIQMRGIAARQSSARPRAHKEEDNDQDPPQNTAPGPAPQPLSASAQCRQSGAVLRGGMSRCCGAGLSRCLRGGPMSFSSSTLVKGLRLRLRGGRAQSLGTPRGRSSSRASRSAGGTSRTGSCKSISQ